MTSFEITRPSGGSVTLELDWDDAEILTRAIGCVNSGNLQDQSPALFEIARVLNQQFGRNMGGEARKYLGTVGSGQVYIERARNK